MWSGLTMTDARNGIEMVKPQFINEVINDQIYWFPESVSFKKLKSPTVFLLPNYDEYFIGFKDRSAIGTRVKTSELTAQGNALLANLVVVNGQVVGGWKRTLKKNEVEVQLNLVTALTEAEHKAVAQAAQRYGAFLGLPAVLV